MLSCNIGNYLIKRQSGRYTIMRMIDIDYIDILLNEKKEKNILIYDISYKTFMESIPLLMRFDEIDGFIKIYVELDI